MCDSSKDACKIIEKNIKKTHLEQKVKLINLDYLQVIKQLKNEKFDIIYLDPPYKTDYIKQAIKELLNQNIITINTQIIAETAEEEKVLHQIEEIPNIEIIDKRKYGRAHILFLRKISGKGE